MDNEKWTMDHYGVAFGDDLESFPKEIPQFSIINYPLNVASCVVN